MDKKWFVVTDTSRQDELGNGPEDWCVSPHEDDTADAIAWMNSDYDDVDANACLMATAPEMLSLLQRIRQWYHLDRAVDGEYWKQKIDDVIKKAMNNG